MSLSAKDARLVRLSTAIVLGRWDDLRRLRARAPSGEPDRAWREAALQTHLFAGFPRLVEAYGVLERAGGLGPLDEGEYRAEPDRPERGAELFARIYAASAGEVRELLRRHHPDFADWVAGHAYGRVLARPGLEPGRRELLAVAALAALGQERQLASHARGALRCGASAGEVRASLEEIAPWLGPHRLARALEIVERFA